MTTPIQPTSYGPLGTANLLTIRGVGPIDDSGCPNYVYDIADKQLVSPEVAATDESPAVAAVYSITPVTSGNTAMDKDQWDNWGKTPTDEEYQLSCIAANLGLTRA